MSETRGTRVYVGNLCEKVKKEDLEGEFTKYGKLNSVWVAFNPPGFAFVEFENRDDAEKACDLLNGTEVLGSKLRVEISKGRPKGRDGGNRFGGRGRPGQQGGGGPFRNGPGGYRRNTGFGGGGRDGGFGGGRNGGGPRDFKSGGGGNGRSAPNGFRSNSGGGGGGGGRFRSRSPTRNNRF